MALVYDSGFGVSIRPGQAVRCRHHVCLLEQDILRIASKTRLAESWQVVWKTSKINNLLPS